MQDIPFWQFNLIEIELMCPFPLIEYLKVQTHLRSSIIWHVIFHSFQYSTKKNINNNF